MVSKKAKKVKQAQHPLGDCIRQGGNPEQFYYEHPSWCFAGCDMEMWSINGESVRNIFWDVILPKMKSLETQTWNEILISAKKQNHAIRVETLNKVAIDRLEELYIEAEAIYSLTIQGTYRIYGLIERGVFSILWIDIDHGDNNTCVCKSIKKHT